MHTEANSLTARGLYLRLLRQALGWSQIELAEKIGASGKNTVSRYEIGENEPGKYLAPLLSALRGSLEDWIALENAPLGEGMHRAHERIDRLNLIRKMTPEQIEKVRRRRNQ